MVKKIKLDFSKVEERSGINTRSMPEGLHAFKIVSVEDKDANDGTPMWVFFLVPESSKYKTRRFPFYCKLQQNQYWKLRDLLVAAGVAVPKKAQMIDPNKVIGKIVAGDVADETGQYAGRSVIEGIYSIDILEGDDSSDTSDDEEYDEEDDEEYEAESDDEDEEYEDEDDEDDVDEEEEYEDDEDDDLNEEDLADEDEDDEEYEDEEPAPAPRKRVPGKKAPEKKPVARKAAPTKAAPVAKRTVKRR